MNQLILQFSSSDNELKVAIKNEFCDGMEFIEKKSFLGEVDIIQALITIGPPLAAFLFEYFSKKLQDRNKTRIVISKDGEMSLEGLSKEEIEDVLKKWLEQ